jgi:L-cystine uptake protein TcyP (sodium:dicarboxylate symporter family)
MRTTRRAVTSNVDEETRMAVMQMGYDLMIALPNNPFMNLHGARVMAVAATAFNSWIDSVTYLQSADEEKDDNKRMEYVKKGIATAHLVHEIATICLLCETGPGNYREKSAKLRDALHEIEEILA